MSGDAALARSMQLEEDDAAHVARRHIAAASRPSRSVQSGQSRVTPVKDLGRVLPKQLTLDDTEDDDAKEDDDFDKDYKSFPERATRAKSNRRWRLVPGVWRGFG